MVLLGSLDLVKIVDAQSSVWFILFQPLGAIVFFICVLAELKRIPFDLPEADSEYGGGEAQASSSSRPTSRSTPSHLHNFLPRGLVRVRGPPPQVWFIAKTFGDGRDDAAEGDDPRVRIDVLLRGGWTKLCSSPS